MQRSVRCGILLAIVVLTLNPVGGDTQSLPEKPPASILAGSGVLGIADGPADRAQFVEPAALAYGPRGVLYIVDRGAQRIRAVLPNGMVHTVAGSGPLLQWGLGVSGGYADGPAKSARFDYPLGIAVDTDGAVYVGDTKNHCVRLIRNQTVSTFAGICTHAGSADGTRLQATFTDPRALAIDSAHSLFVADFPNGIRKITADGAVTTIRTSVPITGLTVGRFSPKIVKTANEVLIATSATSIAVYDLKLLVAARDWSLVTDFVHNTWSAEGGIRVGPAASVAPVDSYSIAYTDLLYRTVRWFALPMESPYERVLTREPRENDALLGGAYRGGSGRQSSFVAPMGIARGPNGTLAVADAGARVIWRLGAFDRRNEETNLVRGDLPSYNANEFHIELVGDSLVNMGQPWPDSMGGDIERRLNDATHSAGRVVRVDPIRRQGSTWEQLWSLITEELPETAADVVIFDLAAHPVTEGSANATADHIDESLPHLIAAKEALARHNIAFYVLFHPGAFQIPSEDAYRMLPRSVSDVDNKLLNDLSVIDPSADARFHDAVIATLRKSGVRYIDAWPPMIAYRASPDALPMFASWDHHLTAAGNHVIGDAVARQLLNDRTWPSRTSAEQRRSG